MEKSERKNDTHLTPEERRLRIDERRLELDHSFARKWLPTLATLMVGVIAAMFSYVQQQASIEETKRARIESKAKEEHSWGIKVIEMYFSNHDLFDLNKDPETAASNLRVLAAVAPTAVQGVLNVELSRIPPPSGDNDVSRINSLAAVAGVQNALAAVRPQGELSLSPAQPSDFTVYLQYSTGDRNFALTAQNALVELGYRVPGIEQVRKVPSRLQVRYYHLEQKTLAGELAGKIGIKLGLRAGPDNAILVTSAKPLPGGILEVWLPRQAG